ncbi:MAG: hypothetical protein ACI9FN_003259, partial [Saprospiraceae bacterium]
SRAVSSTTLQWADIYWVYEMTHSWPFSELNISNS